MKCSDKLWIDFGGISVFIIQAPPIELWKTVEAHRCWEEERKEKSLSEEKQLELLCFSFTPPFLPFILTSLANLSGRMSSKARANAAIDVALNKNKTDMLLLLRSWRFYSDVLVLFSAHRCCRKTRLMPMDELAMGLNVVQRIWVRIPRQVRIFI